MTLWARDDLLATTSAVAAALWYPFEAGPADKVAEWAARSHARFLALIEAGIPVALGSDGPPNPWLDVMLAVVHPAMPAEAITVEQAIEAYTLGAAFAEGTEQEKGSLTPGKLADLVALSQDPFEIPPDQLPATRSLMTVIGGDVVLEDESLAGATLSW